MSGWPWGYCDPNLHNGQQTPATWWVRGMEQPPTDILAGAYDVWVASDKGFSTWACCHRHLIHACRDLLERFARVSVVERP